MAVSLREYDALLIVDPALNEEGLTQLKTQVGDLVTKNGGKVQESTVLGKRRLTFKIGKYSEGNYIQVRIQMPAETVEPFKRTVNLIEPVVRIMVLTSTGLPQALPQPAAAGDDED